MKRKDFERLVNGVKQAGAIRKGRLKPGRVTELRPDDVRATRPKAGKSPEKIEPTGSGTEGPVVVSPHAYSENQLVERAAIELFAAMGWQTVSALDELFGAGGTLGRETKGEAVLLPRLRAALEQLNPALPPEAICTAVDELTRDRAAMSLAAANCEVYGLLRDGLAVSVPDRERGGQKVERVRLIDWQHAAANDFLLASQLSLTGALYTRRPDLVGFVNGVPLVVVELKKPGVPARAAFDDNLTCYLADVPQLFWPNALLIASNGTDSRVGSLTAGWEHFGEWRKVEREDEAAAVSLEKMLRGTCEPARLLDLIESFTCASLFEHVYESYRGEGASVFTTA